MRRLRPGSRASLLTALVLAAFIVRCWQLGAAGFSEDEISKLRAAEAYRRLDFTSNAEHPMLMKLAVLASVGGASVLNRAALDRTGLSITHEAALRFPNAMAGALTTACVFLLAEALLGITVAWWAAFLWAFDVNAIAISRIGKEDSLLVFFLLLAAWCYERGKQATPAHGAYSPEGQRWFTAAGAAFGLMAATKYMPYFFALHVLFCRAADPEPSLNRPDKGRYFGAMAIAFFAANFAILLPQNWMYLFHYTAEQLMTHTGYVFAGKLYVNLMSATPWGVPSYFYLAYLGTKVPLVVLLATGAGLVAMTRRPRDRGMVFLRVFLVFILVPYSLVASKFVRYLLPLLAILDMIAAVGIARIIRGFRLEPEGFFRLKPEATLPPEGGSYRFSGGFRFPAFARGTRASARPRRSLGGGGQPEGMAVSVMAAVVLAAPLTAVATAAPHYALYRNAVSLRVAGDTLLFPHCELYDAGVREAARLVAERAQPGAVIVSEAPRVVNEYVHSLRADLRFTTLTHDGIAATGTEVWVLVQDGRIYYENLPSVALLRATRPVDADIRVAGVSAVQVYRLPGARVPLHTSR